MVPEATNRPASLPINLATWRCNWSAVGSEPRTSSSTSAFAIAAPMLSVGLVTVSERRSTTRGVDFDSSGTEEENAKISARHRRAKPAEQKKKMQKSLRDTGELSQQNRRRKCKNLCETQES
jgi:hypothetical protein